MGARIAEVGLRTVTGFTADRCGIAAAGITYFALVSIFPLALVALSVTGFVVNSEADQARLIDAIMERLPLDEGGGREDLTGVITSIVAARGTLGFFGIAGALYTGSALFTSVRVALNSVFHGEKPRPAVLGKLIDIGMVLLFGGLLTVSTGASFALGFFGRFAEDVVGQEAAPAIEALTTAGYFTIPPLLSFGLFLLLYARIPAAAVRWKYAVPGAALAAVLFELLKGGFGLYAANFGNYDATYGSLGFVILLLAFIYFANQVMLLGAEAARATAEVAEGWPFPPGESRVAAVKASIATARAKVRQLVRRGSGEEAVNAPGKAPRLAIPGAEMGAAALLASQETAPAKDGPSGANAETFARDGRPRPSAGSWLAALAVAAGILAASVVSARRR